MVKKALLISTWLIALGGCQMTNRDLGTYTGAAAGGLLGNTVGKGSGKHIATGVGAVLGAIVGGKVGESMDRPPVVVRQTTTNQSTGPCSYMANAGERAACKRGVADREKAVQRERESNAYNLGRSRGLVK